MPPAPPFRDQQLLQSGISIASQKCKLTDGNIIERYGIGTMSKGLASKDGDDMILNFVDLNGSITTYIHPLKNTMTPFQRVRFKYPQHHKDKEGNNIKYIQASKSGSHLWIPELTRRAFISGKKVSTLFVTEGEKKADKLSMHGMISIGLMGIHNLSLDEKMSNQFERFISNCDVKKVVFLLDSDWQNLSKKEDKPVDARPNTFFSAVKKFRDYFYHFNKKGISLDIYLAHIKDNVNGDKGADDLLTNTLKREEHKLLEDFEKAIIDREGEGEYVGCFNITTMSEYKLKALWLLDDVKAFFERHKTMLAGRENFKFGKMLWTFDEEGNLTQQNLLSAEEQFWKEEISMDKAGNPKKKYYFEYQNIRVYLRNQGFGRHILPNGNFRFVKVKGKVVREVNQAYIANYVIKFTEEVLDEKEVLSMLLRGGSQYLGPEKFEKMYELKLDFISSGPDYQFLFFEDEFWKVTKDGIQRGNLDELPGYIWEDQIIKHSPKLLDLPLIEVKLIENRFKAGQSELADSCHIAKFLERTSTFDWRKNFKLMTRPFGLKKWEQVSPMNLTLEQEDIFTLHVVTKILALGYLLHSHSNPSEAKAIICMDGAESEVGTSEGGTDKSIFGKCLGHVVPMVTLDGKKPKIVDDNFLYEEVDERTRILFFDDCRVDLDFEVFFGQITTGITVNGKGVKRFTLPPPKFLFTTNHAINGEGNSFKRRQYLVAFSDWYNEHRTPKDDFGCILFDNWDENQWSLFFNYIACCIKNYLTFGLKYSIPIEDLEKRKLRQQIGENFLEWANTFFHKDGNRNLRVGKQLAYDDFQDCYPNSKRFSNIRTFKKKVKQYCHYSSLHFNPGAPNGDGTDIKSSGKEYLIVADDNFDASLVQSLP